MTEQIADIAERLKGLRESLDMTPAAAAAKLGIPQAEYLAHEQGERDFTFTFLYSVSQLFRVNIEDLLTGRSPTLSSFSIVRKGSGLNIMRRQGFKYQNMAYHFRDRTAEPFIVEAVYDEAEARAPIHLNTHEGQEFDFVLKGALRMVIDGHEFTLGEGDSVYYNSAHGHGMVAADSRGCEFLAVVMQK
jgi:mannose-6-phosphate isomerase-like protein (cupin superfamily)/DNA-binding XRE family transcriptional regulator